MREMVSKTESEYSSQGADSSYVVENPEHPVLIRLKIPLTEFPSLTRIAPPKSMVETRAGAGLSVGVISITTHTADNRDESSGRRRIVPFGVPLRFFVLRAKSKISRMRHLRCLYYDWACVR